MYRMLVGGVNVPSLWSMSGQISGGGFIDGSFGEGHTGIVRGCGYVVTCMNASWRLQRRRR